MVAKARAPWTGGLMIALAGCATGDVAFDQPPPGYLADAPARVAAADWAAAEPATVVLDEYSFAPQHLTFRSGMPYRLHLENRGGHRHTFTSEGFFKAIAAHRLRAADGEITGPYLKTIELAPGAAEDLEFVAVTPGTYGLECSVFLHDVFGMTGEITIEPEAMHPV